MADYWMRYGASKYCGGTYCGCGDFDTLEEVMRFADDGFCDYVRVVDYANGNQTMKIHFEPTEERMFDNEPGMY